MDTRSLIENPLLLSHYPNTLTAFGLLDWAAGNERIKIIRSFQRADQSNAREHPPVRWR